MLGFESLIVASSVGLAVGIPVLGWLVNRAITGVTDDTAKRPPKTPPVHGHDLRQPSEEGGFGRLSNDERKH